MHTVEGDMNDWMNGDGPRVMTAEDTRRPTVREASALSGYALSRDARGDGGCDRSSTGPDRLSGQSPSGLARVLVL